MEKRFDCIRHRGKKGIHFVADAFSYFLVNRYFVCFYGRLLLITGLGSLILLLLWSLILILLWSLILILLRSLILPLRRSLIIGLSLIIRSIWETMLGIPVDLSIFAFLCQLGSSKVEAIVDVPEVREAIAEIEAEVCDGICSPHPLPSLPQCIRPHQAKRPVDNATTELGEFFLDRCEGEEGAF